MKSKVLFIGRFVPPVHGAAMMNESYFNSKIIKKNFDIDRLKINYSKKVEEIGKFSMRKIFMTVLLPFILLYKLILFRPNLVYFEIAPNGLAFYRDSFLVLLCKIFRRKIVFQLHARNVIKNLYSKFVFNNTKMIILSNLLYSEVEGLFDKKDVFVLPNGINDLIGEREFREILEKRKENNKLNIVYLSNMIESKGALDVLKICKSLKIKYNCYFGGQWSDLKFKAKWENYLKENNLQDNCRYLGGIYGAKKKELLAKSDLMIFPTSYENESFPLVILEAFMFGIPVFAYDNGAIKEIITKNYLGKVFKIGDWSNMVNEIEEIKDNSNALKIRRYFKANFEISVAEKKLTGIFRRLL
ncbi:MAG: glycosyltransferase family 4 protein [Nanoarchaeota archaeon]